MVVVSFEIDADLLEQINKLIEPMGLTFEDLIIRFLEFCADPETKEEAARLIRSWMVE